MRDKKLKRPSKKEKNKLLREFFNWFILLLVAVITGYAVIAFLFQTVTVVGPSMNNTLKDGDVVIVNKLNYKYKDVERFDVIAFSLVENNGYYDIKRVVGMPGETITIKEGSIYVDDRLLSSDVVVDNILTAGIAKKGVKLGDNEYFVIGDNVNNSEDSRYTNIGNISKSEILGKVVYVIKPKERRGKIR